MCKGLERRIYPLQKVRHEGVAVDQEEYIEGMVALGIPIQPSSGNLQAAIWVVALKQQMVPDAMTRLVDLLKEIAIEINQRLH